jgi:phosphoglycerate dehydrogenase-like enzyme
MELFGKRVLVVGTGSVGCETAKRFRAFTEEVYGVDLYPSEHEAYRQSFPLERLDEQLSLSDIVILTLPLTEQTRGMFDAERFASMKPGAVLVNIARGGIVDEMALCEALDGRLYGAVMDVCSVEPLEENSPLWDKENLILSPHNSFVSEGNGSRMWDVIIKNLSLR